ncbi:MAG: hypothetical protein LBM00_04555 [Deltaproteobacteria bacterium]|jgi:hypothetical protein|nr:hypothetical protein [Deltaproteobacteria bacterium]
MNHLIIQLKSKWQESDGENLIIGRVDYLDSGVYEKAFIAFAEANKRFETEHEQEFREAAKRIGANCKGEGQ